MSDKLSTRVYDHVCRAMLAGTLRAGARLSEQALARQTGVSRSPVREALIRLQAEGLIEHVPRLGASVRTPTPGDVDDVGSARRWLEAGAASALAQAGSPDATANAQRANDAILALARAAHQRGEHSLRDENRRALGAHDTEFHLALVDAAGSALAMATVIRALMLQRIAGGISEIADCDGALRLYVEHDQVLRAIRRRDQAASAAAVYAHLAVPSDPTADMAATRRKGQRDWPEEARLLFEQLHAGAPRPAR